MSAALSYARVRENLEHLAMSASLAALDSVLERGQKEEKLVVEVNRPGFPGDLFT